MDESWLTAEAVTNGIDTIEVLIEKLMKLV